MDDKALLNNLLCNFGLSSLVLGGADVEPFSNALIDGIESFTLSILSLPQLGHESSQLLFPEGGKLSDNVKVLCVLQQDGHCHIQSAIEPPAILTESNLWGLVFSPAVNVKTQEQHCYL